MIVPYPRKILYPLLPLPLQVLLSRLLRPTTLVEAIPTVHSRRDLQPLPQHTVRLTLNIPDILEHHLLLL